MEKPTSLDTPLDRSGRALVEPDLSIAGHPEVFVIGDAAAAVRLDDANGSNTAGTSPQPSYVPGLAAAANQMGEHAAEMISRTIDGHPRRPFHYRDRGTLAVIGRGRAIADFGRLTLTGRSAFLTWLFAHIAYLAGFRNRVSVMLEWAYAYFTYRPGARIIAEHDRPEATASAAINMDRRRAS